MLVLNIQVIWIIEMNNMENVNLRTIKLSDTIEINIA